MQKTSDLKAKDVVNVLDGKRLGVISDIELDVETGQLKGIVIPGAKKYLGICGRNEDIVVPWDQITKIGDCILVETSVFTDLADPKKETPNS
jgi:YlmC/YmxH family sporulation protein